MKPPTQFSPPPTKKPLTGRQRAIANRFEEALGGQWRNDAGKWVLRSKNRTDKAERVVAEVENAIKEQRITTTAGQFVEDTWKRFT